MIRAPAALLVALGGSLAGGCAAHPAQPGDARNADAPPVELSLIDVEGRRFGLSQLRGQPLLLFVFTTYDNASQLALTPLTTFLREHPALPALGIAAQPDPAELLGLYRDALDLHMPLAYEAEPQIVAGRSMLGPIETVPAYVLLDAQGRIAGRRIGAMTAEQLEEFADPVLP